MVDIFGVHAEGQWAWMDPGAFALIGAASFFWWDTWINHVLGCDYGKANLRNFICTKQLNQGVI